MMPSGSAYGRVGEDRRRVDADPLRRTAHALAQQPEALAEAEVADDRAIGDARGEDIRTMADAELPTGVRREDRDVHDPPGLDPPDVPCQARQHERQQVEREPGVHARRDDRGAVVSRELMDGARVRAVLGAEPGKLLGGADDRPRAAPGGRIELAVHIRKARGGRHDDDVGSGRSEHLVGIHSHPRLGRGRRHGVGAGLSLAFGSARDDTEDLDPGSAERQLHHRTPDATEPEDDQADPIRAIAQPDRHADPPRRLGLSRSDQSRCDERGVFGIAAARTTA